MTEVKARKGLPWQKVFKLKSLGVSLGHCNIREEEAALPNKKLWLNQTCILVVARADL
jgi:hypothetical protein